MASKMLALKCGKFLRRNDYSDFHHRDMNRDMHTLCRFCETNKHSAANRIGYVSLRPSSVSHLAALNCF